MSTIELLINRTAQSGQGSFIHKRKHLLENLVKLVKGLPSRILVDVAVVIKAFRRHLNSIAKPLSLEVVVFLAHKTMTVFETIARRSDDTRQWAPLVRAILPITWNKR